jgi:hypothetical protein
VSNSARSARVDVDVVKRELDAALAECLPSASLASRDGDEGLEEEELEGDRYREEERDVDQDNYVLADMALRKYRRGKSISLLC